MQKLGGVGGFGRGGGERGWGGSGCKRFGVERWNFGHAMGVFVGEHFGVQCKSLGRWRDLGGLGDRGGGEDQGAIGLGLKGGIWGMQWGFLWGRILGCNANVWGSVGFRLRGRRGGCGGGSDPGGLGLQ